MRYSQFAPRSFRGLGDGSQPGPGASSSLPQNIVPGTQGVPAAAGGSIVQGDGFYYVYNITPAASIANGVVSTVTQQFDQVTVFKWVRSTVYVDLAGAAQTPTTGVIPLVSLKITDTGSGMSFMSSAVPLPSIAGNAQLPYVLPTPQFILANAVIQFVFTNISAGTTYTALQFQMHGYKLYNYNQSRAMQAAGGNF